MKSWALGSTKEFQCEIKISSILMLWVYSKYLCSIHEVNRRFNLSCAQSLMQVLSDSYLTWKSFVFSHKLITSYSHIYKSLMWTYFYSQMRNGKNTLNQKPNIKSHSNSPQLVWTPPTEKLNLAPTTPASYEHVLPPFISDLCRN